ncbi:MAG: phospholipid carrier-dependent glycosyltransferase [Luteitalea sp.]|nr:phospholipid carrier-dependent glycosyltransferase [Luteitalea sp.]
MPTAVSSTVTARPLRIRGRFLPIDPVLILILAFGAALRLLYVTAPFGEAHHFRQLYNADIARAFAEESLNIFYPMVNWGGPARYVATEFPLSQFLVGLLYVAFGENEIYGRVVSIVFSLGTVAAVYALGRYWFGASVGRGAAFLLAISPSQVFFGRTFLSDVPMVCFSVMALLWFTVYVDTARRSALIAGAISLAVAGMVKLPAVLVLAPIFYLAWEQRRGQWLRDRRLLVATAIALIAIGAWYVHGYFIFKQTGLTVPLYAASAVYPSPLADTLLPFESVSHWPTVALLVDPAFYADMLNRVWDLHLTPLGVAGAALGFLLTWRSPRRRIVDVWMLAGVLFFFATANGQSRHEYYQLPLLPPATLYFGLAAAPLFDKDWLGSRGPRVLMWTAAAVLLAALAAHSFHHSQIIPRYFRPDPLPPREIQAGNMIAEVTDPQDLFLTVEFPSGGNQSPILLYRAHRIGWSLDLDAITPEAIQLLQREYKVRYFATNIWDVLVARRPDIAEYLSHFRTVHLPGMVPRFRLIDLSVRVDPPGTP